MTFFGYQVISGWPKAYYSMVVGDLSHDRRFIVLIQEEDFLGL